MENQAHETMESKEIYHEGPVTEVTSREEDKVGTLTAVGESDNRNGDGHMGKYRRTFLSRHIQIVTLGSNIGSGLFISTGKALRNGGPGNMIVGYTLVMTMVTITPEPLTAGDSG
jgi:amino acid transporter